MRVRPARGPIGGHFGITREVVAKHSLAIRMVLAEPMWQVALVDGELDGQESYLMRKLANILQLEPAPLAEARKTTAEEWDSA